MAKATRRYRNTTRRSCCLSSPGWNQQTRRALETLIQRGSGRNLPVVLDFDNTLIRGDVQEATLAMLARSGRLSVARLPATLSPAFRAPGRGLVTTQAVADLMAYYEAYLAPTAHGDRDPTSLANAYAWAVEVMVDLRLTEVLEATRAACALARHGQPGFIEATPGQTRYPAPSFHPEMIELMAELIRHRFEVWIVSASNAWSVRWMVLRELNPRLRELGLRRGLPPERVIGMTTLLTDDCCHLYKDAVLVRENPRYAALEDRSLRRFRLTSRLQFPVPTYSGKVACILETIGARPYLCVGDSPGDHAMLAFSRHRLWMARLEKSEVQRQWAGLVRKTGNTGWMVQPVIAGKNPGFIAQLDALPERLGTVAREIRAAAGILAGRRRRGAV